MIQRADKIMFRLLSWTNSGWIITVHLLLDIFNHIEDSPIHKNMLTTKDEASKVGSSLIQYLGFMEGTLPDTNVAT